VLHAASAAVGVATANLYPQVTLSGRFGTTATRIGDLFGPGSAVWGFGAGLLQPIFHGGALEAARLAEVAGFDQAAAMYRETVLQAFREVADLLNAREKLAEQLDAQQANAKAQNQRLKLVEARYQAGIANHLEVLDAQRESFAAEQGSAQVRRTALSAAAQLYKALAGEGSHAAGNKARQESGK